MKIKQTSPSAYDEWIQKNSKADWTLPPMPKSKIWEAGWNAAIEAVLLRIPGGNICDPQTVADEIRTLISEDEI